MSNERGQRYVEGGLGGRDGFDEMMESEKRSIGGTQAANVVFELQEKVHPNGLGMNWICNCGGHQGIVVEWSELAAVAHGFAPDQPIPPSNQRMTDDRWAVDSRTKAFSPQVGCRLGCHNPKVTWLTMRDAQRALEQGVQNGYTSHDPNWRRAQAVFNPMRQARGMEPI
jgi:hypothetical protein